MTTGFLYTFESLPFFKFFFMKRNVLGGVSVFFFSSHLLRCICFENVSTAFNVVQSPRAEKVAAGNDNHLKLVQRRTRTRTPVFPTVYEAETSCWSAMNKYREFTNDRGYTMTVSQLVIVKIWIVLLFGLPCPCFIKHQQILSRCRKAECMQVGGTRHIFKRSWGNVLGCFFLPRFWWRNWHHSCLG